MFLERYADIDVALDTFPYNGGTTTTEALWQGVPVMSFAGDRWAARISASILREAGLAEFVAPDLDGFVTQAVALARDPDIPARLDTLRSTMRERLRAAPVCDVSSFARNMEEAYLEMWRLHAERS
jgi:protein O-GlcNAc transferase